MCLRFDSWTRRHMWIKSVVGSHPCSQGFSPGSPVFLPPQKPTFLNSNSIGNSRATGLSVEDCCVSPSSNKVDLFIFISFRLESPAKGQEKNKKIIHNLCKLINKMLFFCMNLAMVCSTNQNSVYKVGTLHDAVIGVYHCKP